MEWDSNFCAPWFVFFGHINLVLFCLAFFLPSGLEFDELSPPDQAEAAGGLAVFARVEPSHKTKLVELLKQQVCDIVVC